MTGEGKALGFGRVGAWEHKAWKHGVLEEGVLLLVVEEGGTHCTDRAGLIA